MYYSFSSFRQTATSTLSGEESFFKKHQGKKFFTQVNHKCCLSAIVSSRENALVANYSAMLIVDLGVLMADVQCLCDGSGGGVRVVAAEGLLFS